ncbi:MAG: HAD family phosphatase [Niameybacter sp.]
MRMKRTFDAVIFDLDGTLIDSMWVWSKIDEAYLGRYGLEVEDSFEAELEGKSFTETAVYVKERFQISESVEEIKAEWNKMAAEFYQTQVPLKKHVREFLEFVETQGLKMGIATSNSQELVAIVLEAHGIREKFQVICTSCEVERGKPYPYVYQKVAQDLEVAPERCLAFEDVPNGVLAAKRAGMTICAIRDCQTVDMEKVLRQEADYFVEDYKQILDYYKNDYKKSYA